MNVQLRVLLVVGAILFLGLTIYYIRKKHLDLYHSIRWFAGAVVILIMALFPDAIETLTHLAGIEIPSNLVFLMVIVYLLLTCLSLSASVSRQHARIRALVQSNAQLENRVRELEKKMGLKENEDTGGRSGI